MIRRVERHLLVGHWLIDIIVTLCALRIADGLRRHMLLGVEQRSGHIVLDTRIYIVAALIWGLVFQLLPVFNSKRTTTLPQEFVGLVKAVGICVLAMASLFYWLALPPSRLFFLYFTIVDLGLLIGFHALVRYVQRLARAHGYNTRNVVIVGAGPAGEAVVASIKAHAWSGLRLVGIVDDNMSAQQGAPSVPATVAGVPVLGPIALLPRLLLSETIDEVIIALPSTAHDTIVHLSHELQRFPVVVKVAPDILDLFLMQSQVTDLWGLPLLSVREPAITGTRWAFKRILDVVLASVLLIVLSPALALIALAIRLQSGSPVLFRQERVGEHGRVFYMLKFRTMAPLSEDSTVGRPTVENAPIPLKGPHNPRVTPLGARLRRTSLDELPQLVNVLRGEMSLVGPRPELPSVVQRYEPWQHARHLVPPGMTGWWQINGRSELPLHLNTHLDLFYIKNFSVLLDLRILARTLGVVIRGRGAY